jgi:hypothetical protein
MKLSQLRSLCDKAIEKYGDINVGAYDKEYAQDVEAEDNLHDFKLRIIPKGGDLPGDSLCQDEESNEELPGYFACIFYGDSL